jgi:hypothetical protein
MTLFHHYGGIYGCLFKLTLEHICLAAVTETWHVTKLTRFVLLSEYSCYSDGLRAKRPGFDSRQGQEIIFCTASRPALGPIQLPIQCLPGVTRLGHEADYLHIIPR